MVEVELAESETEHADWRIDDAFPRKRRDQEETLAGGADNVEQPFPRESLVGVRRTDTLDLNSRSFGCGQLAEVTLQQDRQCAPFGIHRVPSDHLLGTLYRRFLCGAMPNRKYGAFNIKMTNTIKEGCERRRMTVRMSGQGQREKPSPVAKMEPKCERAKLKKAQEILRPCPLPGATSWFRKAHQMFQRARMLPGLCVVASMSSTAFAQPEVIRCLAPEVPITDLPEAVLSEYRAEIAAEFEPYFAALSNHIACLDAERSRALSEARVATEAYSTFLNIPPAQKDLP